MHRVLALLSVVAVVACAEAPAPQDENSLLDSQEQEIGWNDFIPIQPDGGPAPARYQALFDAVGWIRLGCTATHLGNGLVITAGHCVKAPQHTVYDQPCPFPYTTEWGRKRDYKPYLISTCQRILAMEYSPDRDYAFMRVSPVPRAAVKVDLSSRPADQTDLTIFGHPYSRTLEWSPPGARSHPPCRLTYSENADGGYTQFPGMFNHQCDTQIGSSGSAILRDSDLTIVGIHSGGGRDWGIATYITETPLAQFLP